MNRMTKINNWAVVGAILLSVVTGCQALTGKTAGRNIDDANITASVKATIVADKVTNLTRVDVDTDNGVVYLNGSVESVQQRNRVEQLARRVDGVKTVVNNLQVTEG